MKKKILGAALIAAMAITAGWNFNQNKNEVELSDIALANISALARGELPEVEINCGANSGACWTKNGVICFIGSKTYEACSFVGYTYLNCSSPCN